LIFRPVVAAEGELCQFVLRTAATSYQYVLPEVRVPEVQLVPVTDAAMTLKPLVADVVDW
jgi:hypothetical protein